MWPPQPKTTQSQISIRSLSDSNLSKKHSDRFLQWIFRVETIRKLGWCTSSTETTSGLVLHSSYPKFAFIQRLQEFETTGNRAWVYLKYRDDNWTHSTLELSEIRFYPTPPRIRKRPVTGYESTSSTEKTSGPVLQSSYQGFASIQRLR